MADQTPKDEKTEEATAHKLDQTREKGQVAFSTETMAAAGLLLAVIGFLTSGGLMASNFGEGLRAAPVMASTLGRTDPDNVDPDNRANGLIRTTGQMLWVYFSFGA